MSTTGGTPVDRREREVSPEAAPLAAVVSELDLETVTMEELEALAGTVGGIPLEMSFSRSPSSALTATPSSSRSASSSRSPSLSVTPRVDEAQIRGGALGHQFALLEAAVREKDAMLANIGKQHLLELKVLQDQVRALMRERGELESRIDSADRRHAAALRAERRKADAAVGALREQLAALEERAPVVASRMALSTADIATLRVPTDAQYAKLSRTPASRRSIKAQLAVKVYELTEAIRADAVAADTRLHALDDTVESAKANVVRLTRERDALTTKVAHLESELAATSSMAAKDAALLSSRLSVAREELAAVKEASAAALSARSELDTARSQSARYRAQIEDLTARLRAEEGARAQAAAKAGTLESENKVLSSSLAHVKDELASLRQSSGEAGAALQTALSQNAALKADQDRLYAKFLEFKSHSDTLSDGRLAELVGLFQRNTAATHASVTDATSSAYERELSLLREARAEAADQVRYLKTKLEAAEAAHTTLLGEYQSLQLSITSSAAQQASEVTTKTIELERLQVAHKALTEAHARLGIQHDALLQKLDIVRAEYASLTESSASTPWKM